MNRMPPHVKEEALE